MNKKGQTKLLAAVAVFAMVACALAVVMPVEEVQGASFSSITEFNEAIGTDNVTLDAEFSINDGDKLTIPEGRTLTINSSGKLIVLTNGEVENNGTIIVNAPNVGQKFILKGGTLTGGTVKSDGSATPGAYCVYVESGKINDVTFESYRMAVMLDENLKGNVDITRCIFGDGGKAAIYIQGTQTCFRHPLDEYRVKPLANTDF